MGAMLFSPLKISVDLVILEQNIFSTHTSDVLARWSPTWTLNLLMEVLQWAAVSTILLVMIEPPQKGRLLEDCFKAACQGYSF